MRLKILRNKKKEIKGDLMMDEEKEIQKFERNFPSSILREKMKKKSIKFGRSGANTLKSMCRTCWTLCSLGK
jgi:hypothetical protein